jgi:hypothetical protein
MSDVRYTFHVDQALEKAFVTVAEEQDLMVVQILRDLMRRALTENREVAADKSWAFWQITAAMNDADGKTSPRLINETFGRALGNQREELSQSGSEPLPVFWTSRARNNWLNQIDFLAKYDGNSAIRPGDAVGAATAVVGENTDVSGPNEYLAPENRYCEVLFILFYRIEVEAVLSLPVLQNSSR